MESSREYFDAVSQGVNLNKLYKLEETLCDNRNSLFSLVLLKITDPDFLTLNGESEFHIRYCYLLQVWSNKGQLYYERKMVQKPCMMNIIGKVVIFKEETESNNIFIVKLRSTKHPSLFKFTLPSSFFGDR